MVIGFAHRGARLEHPDNTLPGFARALALGASGLESDAWVTADGVAVLDHDGYVRRGLRRLRISTLPRSELPAHIPALAELLSLRGAGDVEVSLDVKDPGALPAVLAAAGPHRRRLWLCGGHVDLLREWRRRDGTVRLVHSSSLRSLRPDPRGHISALAEAGIDVLNLRGGEWTEDLVGACHRAGIRAFGWDAQGTKAVERLAAMGLDGVYSDHVAAMVAALRSEQAYRGDGPHPEDRLADDQVP